MKPSKNVEGFEGMYEVHIYIMLFLNLLINIKYKVKRISK